MALFEWCPLYRGRGAVPASLNTKPPLHKHHHQHTVRLEPNKHFILSEAQSCVALQYGHYWLLSLVNILHGFSGKKSEEKLPRRVICLVYVENFSSVTGYSRRDLGQRGGEN